MHLAVNLLLIEILFKNINKDIFFLFNNNCEELQKHVSNKNTIFNKLKKKSLELYQSYDKPKRN